MSGAHDFLPSEAARLLISFPSTTTFQGFEVSFLSALAEFKMFSPPPFFTYLCHVHAEAVLQRAQLAASRACRDGSNKCQPGGGPRELRLRSKKKGDTQMCDQSHSVAGRKIGLKASVPAFTGISQPSTGYVGSSMVSLPSFSSNSGPVQYSQGCCKPNR